MLIQRYLARRLFTPILGVFAFAMVVVAVFYLAQVLNWAASDGWPIEVVLAMAGLRLLLYLDVLIPVAVLVGVVIGWSRINQANEWVALASVGMSRVRLISMLAGWVVLVILLVATISMIIRPWGYGQVYQLEASLAERLDVTQVEPGRFQVGDASWLIYAKNRQGNELSNVFVHQRRGDGRGLLTASSMSQASEDSGLTRLLFRGDVNSYLISPLSASEGASTGRPIIARFDALDVLVETEPPMVREKIRRALSMRQLFRSNEAIEIAELQWRWVGALSVPLLAWLAMGLVSTKPRSHRAFPIFAALVVGTVYFSALGVLVNWVEQGKIGAVPGVFAAPMFLALALMGTALVSRMSIWWRK